MNATEPAMSEASLESSLRSTLDRLFTGPLRPKITHQAVLSLRFGHHEVTVDGETRAEARGRLDVLLKADALPLAVLELKRPGLMLTEDDETQAWSYARLIHPMPPLYVVTNGGDTRIFRTYDRDRLIGQTVDDALLAQQLTTAARAAAEDEAFAIRFLLGRSPDVFRQLFQTVSEAELKLSTGAVGDYAQPITEEFQVLRVSTAAAQQLIGRKQPVIALVGPALAGKTNVAAQLCYLAYRKSKEVGGFVPLYINCSQRPQSLFQTLATGLTKQTKVPASAEDVRQWLTSGFATADEARPVIILDGWPSRSADRWDAELSELLDLVSETTFSLVLVLDDAQASRMLSDPERGQRTRLGAMAKCVKVSPIMRDDEFHSACHTLHDWNGLAQELGSERSLFFRFPYTWRLLASYPAQSSTVPSVLGVEFISLAKKFLNPSPEHQQYLRQYAKAVVEEDADGLVRDVLIGSPGWVSWETAERVVGIRGLDRLQEARLIRARTGPRGRTLFSMQLPPVLAAIGADLIYDRLAAKSGSITTRAAADLIVKECQRFPYAAVVGAAVVLTCGRNKDLVAELLSRPPAIRKISHTARFAVPVEGREAIEVPEEVLREAIEEGFDHTASDPFPHLILSYVALKLDLTDATERATWERVVEAVGSALTPLMAVEPMSREWGAMVPPYLAYDLNGGGSLVAKESGIVEPITSALRNAAAFFPSVFEKFVTRLLGEEGVALPLLNRTLTAAASVAEMDAPHASDAKRWTEALDERVGDRLKLEIRPDKN